MDKVTFVFFNHSHRNEMPQIDMSFDGKSSLGISMQSVHEIPGEYLVSWTKLSVLSIEIIKYIV